VSRWEALFWYALGLGLGGAIVYFHLSERSEHDEPRRQLPRHGTVAHLRLVLRANGYRTVPQAEPPHVVYERVRYCPEEPEAPTPASDSIEDAP